MRLRVASRTFASAGQRWPVLAMLCVAVLGPTFLLLWFMSRTARSDEAAIRLQMAEAQREQLRTVALYLEQYWLLLGARLRGHAGLRPAERFAALVRELSLDGVVVVSAAGMPTYPERSALLPPAGSLPPAWAAAARAEFEHADAGEAARLYAALARTATDPQQAARAWQAHARCLLKTRQTATAIDVLTGVLQTPRYRAAVDAQGRWIAPNSLLLAMERMPDRSSAAFRTAADTLASRLADYGSALPSGQRRFIAGQLRQLAPAHVTDPLLAADELSAAAVTAGLPAYTDSLVPSGVPGVWALWSTDRSAVALLREDRVRADLLAQLRGQDAGSWAVLPPPVRPAPEVDATQVRRLDAPLRGWQIVRRAGPDPIAAVMRRRQRADLGLAAVVIVMTSLLTFVAGQRVSRQIESTRLKNDLLATVSHELKTPLSSMRVLVDTLLDGAVQDPGIQREYLEIIARENHRLSGLIENFLTFSRMERGRHVFEFTRVGIPDVVERVVASAGDRLRAPGCRFDIDVPDDLPPVHADRDALVTVVLNLVDNALKYSGAEKHIVLRGYDRDRNVYLEVEDNGIGFSRRVGRRIFERFFQAHRDTAGSAAGVGLGLSIVKYIVTAHHGRIDVVSHPGKGSKFTVCLPSAS